MNSRNLCNGDYQTSWTIKGHPSLLFERDSQVIFHSTHSTFESFTVYYQQQHSIYAKDSTNKIIFQEIYLSYNVFKRLSTNSFVYAVYYSDQRMRSLIIWSLATTTITNDDLFDYWNYKWHFAMPTTKGNWWTVPCLIYLSGSHYKTLIFHYIITPSPLKLWLKANLWRLCPIKGFRSKCRQ